MSAMSATHHCQCSSYTTAASVLVANDFTPYAETEFTTSAAYRLRKPAPGFRSDRINSGSRTRSDFLTAGYTMPIRLSEEALASAGSTSSDFPQVSPKPRNAIQEPLADAEERPWRGVFVLEHDDEVLFTKQIDITVSKLDKWEPDPIISRRRHDEDDD